jgi:hypothetical protein
MKFIAVYQILSCEFGVEKFMFDVQLLAHALISHTQKKRYKINRFFMMKFFLGFHTTSDMSS